MNTDEYLQSVLDAQKFADDAPELEALREHRVDVESILREHFSDVEPTIRYGGSKAKGTMIREAYDLDIVFYVPSGENGAGDTLAEIYSNVRDALSQDYYVQEKTCALRLKSRNPTTYGIDFHIDVVPGRFTDEIKSDCYLYQKSGEKGRLKTNLEVHISHIRQSGVVDALCLLKLLRVRKALQVKQFIFELLVVKLLEGKSKSSLSEQLEHVLSTISSAEDAISIEDPANPSGNDLMPALQSVWFELRSVAAETLILTQQSDWTAVFGEPAGEDMRATSVAALTVAANDVKTPTRPWAE